MSTKMTSASIIPVLDLQPLLDGDEAGVATLAAELKQALQDIGFFSIINHGVPWELVEEIYEATQTLHSLPQEQKTTSQCTVPTVVIWEWEQVRPTRAK